MTDHLLMVTEVRPLTTDSLAITFRLPQALEPVFFVPPGAHAFVQWPEADGWIATPGRALPRWAFSLCNRPGEPPQIAIRTRPGRPLYHYALRTRVGDTLLVSSPEGGCAAPTPTGDAGLVVALAAGSGIAAVLPHLYALLAANSGVRVRLIYVNRRPASVMFGDELQHLCERHGNRLEVRHYYSREPAAEEGAAPSASPLTGPTLAAEVADAVRMRAMAWYAFGPDGFVIDVLRALRSAGVDRGRVHAPEWLAHLWAA